MSRVKRGVTAHGRHKKIIKLAKGYRGKRSTNFREANAAVMKAGTNAYRDRRLKKRSFKRLWITRISAAVKAHGLNYSRFVDGIAKEDIRLNRKMLSELSVNNAKEFGEIVSMAKKAI